MQIASLVSIIMKSYRVDFVCMLGSGIRLKLLALHMHFVFRRKHANELCGCYIWQRTARNLYAARTEQCICEHTRTCATLNMAQRANELTRCEMLTSVTEVQLVSPLDCIMRYTRSPSHCVAQLEHGQHHMLQ